MSSAFFSLPDLSQIFSLSNQPPLAPIEESNQRSLLLREMIDKIWNSLDLKIILQTAVSEIANLLKLDRCSFLWYFKHTEQVQVVCEASGTNLNKLKPEEYKSWLGCYSLETFGSIATAIAQGELIINCESAGNAAAFGTIARFMSHLGSVKRQSNDQLLGAISNLLVPVKSQDGWIGFIACLSHQPRYWLPSEVELVQIIAQQTELAIRQAKVYEQNQKQTQRERIVHQITTQTRQSFDLATILRSAIAQLLEALAVDRCIVHLVEDLSKEKCNNQYSTTDCERVTPSIYRRNHLFEVCREPFPSTLDNFDTHGPITEWVIENRHPVILSDVTQDERIGLDNQEYQQAEIKSTLVVPVQANGKLHAILYLNQCSHIRYWSKNDQELAQAIGDQLAISIRQAELYAQTCTAAELAETKAQELEKASAELKQVNENLANQIKDREQTEIALHQKNALLQLLQSVAIAANEATNSAEALQICLNQICNYTGWPVGHVYIPDSRGDLAPTNLWFLQKSESFQTFRQVTEATRFPPGTGLPGRVFTNAKPMWIVDVTKDPNFPRAKQAIDIGVKAGFAFPVLVGTEVVAVLEFFSVEAIELDAQLLEVVANIGTQLGRVMERERSQNALRASEAKAREQAQQLEQALHQLQQTQAQLIQTEKMSSLGQMVAGVAHEINNPVNFIHGNISYVNQYTQDLLSLVQLYRKYYPQPASEIQDCIEAIDLEFLVEDMHKMLSSMKIGTDRIRQIVLSLRNFSRLDEAEMKQVDIHEGIDSTLLILQNRLKARMERPNITIIKEYGNLPKVECYAGQLNQVFMNILANAIDVLEENASQNPEIRICTELSNPDYIAVRIADNGCGMSEDVIARLFDPFFTTKPVGKGTGLGLSISYQIVVEKHGGSLKCVSAPGQGTEFWIEIPVHQKRLTIHDRERNYAIAAAIATQKTKQ